MSRRQKREPSDDQVEQSGDSESSNTLTIRKRRRLAKASTVRFQS